MNRLLVRRYSMSSIEEEDESIESDESMQQMERPPSLPSPSPPPQQQQLASSPSVLEWDSELSESEQEFDDDDNENSNDNGEAKAANRALQTFMQSYSKSHSTAMNEKNGSYSPFSIHLYDEEDSTELNAIISDLREFKVDFDEKSSLSKLNSAMSSYSRKSSSLSNNGCVYDLRTLEDQLEAALASLALTINDCPDPTIDSQQQPRSSSDSSACSSGLGEEIGSESFHLYNNNPHTVSYRSKLTNTTDDCDSAFSDSGSTDKATITNHEESVVYRSMGPLKEVDDLFLSTPSEHPSKILVRTYNDDGSTKSIFIDDSMFIRDVLFVLIHKNHCEPDVNYALIEILPDLHMERIFEDHQKLTEAILMWPTVSSNRLSFTKRSEKYTCFQTMSSEDELSYTPNLEGNIYLKEKSRKSWKKHFCVLRSSGLYFSPKGKSKKDLVCLAKFENVELFFGLDWKKKFKSPTDFCFALKHPLIQKKSSKYIKYMCVDTKHEFDRWIRNIRLAKFGQQLKINYLLLDKVMNNYRLSGHFAAVSPTRSETPIEHQSTADLSVYDPRTPIARHQYRPIIPPNDDDEDQNCPIKSASYMDELRQRLERVVNDPQQQRATSYHPTQPSIQTKEIDRRPTLIPPPKLKSAEIVTQIKTPATVGSTPLPRKQIPSFGSLSYRTVDTTDRHQQQMSKSFIIPTKREDHRSASSLSIASKSDSLSFDVTDFSLPPPTFLHTINRTSNITTINRPNKSTLSFRTDSQPSSSLQTKTVPPPPSLKLSAVKAPKPISIASSKPPPALVNNRSVPPVPPRKSSIPRPALKPQPPQRNSSTNLLLRKPHISHL